MRGAVARSRAQPGVLTRQTDVRGRFDAFNEETGPFPPGEVVSLADVRLINIGDDSGTVNFQFHELDANGNPIDRICDESISLGSGEEALPFGGDRPDGSRQCGITEDGSSLGSMSGETSSDAGVQQFWGVRTWGETESQPAYPTPPDSSIGVVSWVTETETGFDPSGVFVPSGDPVFCRLQPDTVGPNETMTLTATCNNTTDVAALADIVWRRASDGTPVIRLNEFSVPANSSQEAQVPGVTYDFIFDRLGAGRHQLEAFVADAVQA